ncbi:MAG: hypothetical protein CTY16_16285 [Methylobacter sp.]|nr:MAG: hypothetical protein CTY16_16285 [Methylobacter sp.]
MRMIKHQGRGNNPRPISSALTSALLLYLVLMAPAHARMDAMQLRLSEAYSQDLRWDNIESAPEWLNGVKPYYHKGWQMHRVLLGPKQQTTVLLPAYETFRLYHPNQTLTGTELDVLVSNGTGLAVKQTPQRSTDGHSLVVSPNSASPLLIHISRPYSSTGDFEVALFVSRKVPIADIAPYRNVVWTSARWCLLAQQPSALPELYNQLPARQPQSFHVNGPARLALKNRLHYGRHASELVQEYRIRYWLDAAPPQDLNFSTSAETSRIITVNAAIEVVGREEQAYLEIPAGRHRLVLETDRDLYMQVLAQTGHDYLFNSLNNPRLPVEEIRKQGLLPDTQLILQAQSAQGIAQDNSRQAGGMAASNLLREAALQRLDYPPGLAEAEQLRGFRTFYRDLLPTKKASASPQFMAYFLAETLPAANRPQSDAILADQHLADALKRLSNAYFTPLTDIGRDAANGYTLPEQQTAGQLRLIVDGRDCVQRLLRIEINQQTAKDIWLRCGQERRPETFTRPLAGTALMRLQQEPDSRNVSLDGLFSAYAPAAPVIAASVYELPLPKDVRTIKIWQASERKATAVNVALQYRASKPFLLSEHSYLERLRDLDGKPITTRFTQNATRPAKTQPNSEYPAQPFSSGQYAENEWLPLKRLLHAEYALYRASVSSTPYPQNQTALFAPKPLLEDEMAQAKTAEKRQQWLEALEHWGKAAHFLPGLERQQAQLAQANALTKLGEPYLAENLRRYLSLYAEAPVGEQAISELGKQYQAQNHDAALQTLAAAMFIHHPSAGHRRLLINALLKNAEYRFALLVGLSFIEQAPLESLLTAAYQLEWWESYQWLQEKLPLGQRAFWVGLKAQKQGDYAAALKAWSASGLKPWHDHLQQGIRLRDSLMQATKTNRLALYGQWAQWQQQHPGSKTWQNALWHVKDYTGGDSYYAVDRDVYAQAVRATAERPVTLGILGPVTLNLQIRPLHPNARPDSALDGWLQITDNTQPYHYPYTNNLPAQGLQVTGADNLQLGNLVNLVYQVGQGWHELQLSSGQTPLSIGIQEQRPETPLTVLPALQTDTFAEMSLASPHATAQAVGKSGIERGGAWQ